MESFLRLRDLPSFRRAIDLSDCKLQHVFETHSATSSYGLILNAFEELEEFSLAHFRTKFQKVYTIGPIHASLKTKTTVQMGSSSGLKDEESECMAWLDDQALKYVVYVSFGMTGTGGLEDSIGHESYNGENGERIDGCEEGGVYEIN
ncbi:unnamed protein product [Fraxinus pennsylvanica]|uniref:Uncharacterized protein n=1 Tax=Fraxinus pennsylvanica TaxID=56036 RepID=A0AAD1Z666_9LAMI|nr:unnamed protein product [Fraxinus pennsylvanica]